MFLLDNRKRCHINPINIEPQSFHNDSDLFRIKTSDCSYVKHQIDDTSPHSSSAATSEDSAFRIIQYQPMKDQSQAQKYDLTREYAVGGHVFA